MSYRDDFPIFVFQPDLVYLDSAATSQKPEVVIERLVNFYEQENANISRGLYQLAEQATKNYELAREAAANFIGAKPSEIIFTRNTTESINLVAATWGRQNLKTGDEIIVTEVEHHSNLLPWQQLAAEKSARLRYLGVDPKTGQLKIDQLKSLIGQKTKILAISHCSNVLGIVNDLEQMVKIFRKLKEGIVVGDLAQTVPHLPIEVKKLDLDFAAFSSHKIYGPLGIGVLYGREDLISPLPPFNVGGGVVESVSRNSSTYQVAPYKFEAGTPNISGAVSLKAALDYLSGIGWENIQKTETRLLEYTLLKLQEIPEVKIYGRTDSKNHLGTIAFNLSNIHPHDVAQSLAEDNIAIRAGHHCAMILHQEVFKVPATCRISLGIYNNEEDIDRLGDSLKKTIIRFS